MSVTSSGIAHPALGEGKKKLGNAAPVEMVLWNCVMTKVSISSLNLTDITLFGDKTM